MRGIGVGTRFTLDGDLLIVVSLFQHPYGTLVKARRLDAYESNLREYGLGMLLYYENIGRLEIVD